MNCVHVFVDASFNWAVALFASHGKNCFRSGEREYERSLVVAAQALRTICHFLPDVAPYIETE